MFYSLGDFPPSCLFLVDRTLSSTSFDFLDFSLCSSVCTYSSAPSFCGLFLSLFIPVSRLAHGDCSWSGYNSLWWLFYCCVCECVYGSNSSASFVIVIAAVLLSPVCIIARIVSDHLFIVELVLTWSQMEKCRTLPSLFYMTHTCSVHIAGYFYLNAFLCCYVKRTWADGGFLFVCFLFFCFVLLWECFLFF